MLGSLSDMVVTVSEKRGSAGGRQLRVDENEKRKAKNSNALMQACVRTVLVCSMLRSIYQTSSIFAFRFSLFALLYAATIAVVFGLHPPTSPVLVSHLAL